LLSESEEEVVIENRDAKKKTGKGKNKEIKIADKKD
jgi:hypothetical protein